MASVGRPRDFGSNPPTGSGRAWGSLHLYNLFTKWRIFPLQNDMQNNGSEFNSFVHKMLHIQKGIICIWRGIYLYAATFSMTLRFLILPSFLFTRNLRIDKNYELSIFMLSGSI